MLNRFFITIAFIVASVVAQAQLDDLTNAIKNFQEGKLDVAKTYIDKATVSSSDPWAWFFKGFLYKELYKSKEKTNRESSARDESIKSFKKSIALDTKKEHLKSNRDNMKFLANTYFNDAVDYLNEGLMDNSIKLYDRYKEVMLDADPAADIKQKEIEYYLAAASVYAEKYEKEGKLELLDKAKSMLQNVLKADPNNIKANYAMAVLYYNQAVKLIKDVDYAIDMVALEQIQDESVVLFKESLPFMEKVYKLDPLKEEAIEGLSGIYFSLNEHDKSEQFKNRLNEIKKK